MRVTNRSGKIPGMFRSARVYTRLIPALLPMLWLLSFGLGEAYGDSLCREVRVAITPDCFRPSLAAACNKRKTGSQLDLGPQIAMWVTDSSGQFVDTVMVTSLTGTRGIGNRPGRWDFRSAPRFPYGKRTNTLPVWAWSRGRVYDSVVMQDGKEDGLGFHESSSSPDPYYCRPMAINEVDVDAISCPTAVFNSAKGRFDSSKKTPYPPRNDLVSFTDRDCDVIYSKDGAACPKSSLAYAQVNDLDAVSRATPPYGRPYEVRRLLPSTVAKGQYFLHVEVSKEFDQNPSHKYPTYQDPQLPESGVETNIGQPSVVYRVPFAINESSQYASVVGAAGYGDWDGRTGTLHALDGTISTSPGSGEGRLLAFASPWTEAAAGQARVHVITAGCESQNDAGADSDSGAGVCQTVVPPSELRVQEVLATSAIIRFRHGAEGSSPLQEYEIRYVEGNKLDDAAFAQGIPAPVVAPAAPGTIAELELTGLKPQTTYMLGIRAKSTCGVTSGLTIVPVQTPQMVFKQLSGCFIATAAYGEPLVERIGALRWARDRAIEQSPLANEAVDAYYRASPALAAVLAESDAGRAAVRALLNPVVNLAEGLRTVFGAPAGSRN